MPRFHYLRYFTGRGRPAGPSLESLPGQCGVVRIPSSDTHFAPLMCLNVPIRVVCNIPACSIRALMPCVQAHVACADLSSRRQPCARAGARLRALLRYCGPKPRKRVCSGTRRSVGLHFPRMGFPERSSRKCGIVVLRAPRHTKDL